MKKLQLQDSLRHRFSSPLDIHWIGDDGALYSSLGKTTDASVYGLGAMVSDDLPRDIELTIIVNGVATCGRAMVRYSQPCSSGFKVGIQFDQALLMQNIPGLDDVLRKSYYVANKKLEDSGFSFLSRIRTLLWTSLIGVHKL